MNKNVPKLRFKEFSDEWKKGKLGDISKIIMGQSPSSNAYNDNKEGLPLVQGNADITKRITTPRMYTSEVTKTCEIEDIIMSVRAPVGSIAISNQVCCIGRGVCSIKARNINQKYLYQVLLDYESKWSKISQGSTFESINSNDIKGLILNIPSLQEQEKIADFFTILDSLIEEQEGKVRDLKIYKKGMMQKIFKQEIRFKDDNGLDYPEWEEKKILEIFAITRGQVIAKTSISPIKTDKSIYPVYSSQTSNYGILGYDSSYDFDGEFLTWTTDGANAGKVFKRNGKFRCTNVCGLLVEKDITKGFANVCIKEILEKETPKHVSYVGNPKLMNGVMGDIKIKIPCLEEQTKIANFLSNIDSLIEEEQKNLDDLREMKKGLLQQMFV